MMFALLRAFLSLYWSLVSFSKIGANWTVFFSIFRCLQHCYCYQNIRFIATAERFIKKIDFFFFLIHFFSVALNFCEYAKGGGRCFCLIAFFRLWVSQPICAIYNVTLLVGIIKNVAIFARLWHFKLWLGFFIGLRNRMVLLW